MNRMLSADEIAEYEEQGCVSLMERDLIATLRETQRLATRYLNQTPEELLDRARPCWSNSNVNAAIEARGELAAILLKGDADAKG